MVQEVKLKMLLFCMDARIRSYRMASGMGYQVSLPGMNIYLTSGQLTALSSVYDFLFCKTDKSYDLDIRLTRNPFTSYVMKDKMLAGPEDGLTNISYGQFIMLQTWQQQMKKDFNTALDNFLAVIWKEGSFSISEEGGAELFKEVDSVVKTVMFWFFLGSMRFIQEKFPRVFSGTGNNGGDVFDIQQRIVDELASGDVTKKEQVKDCLLYDALYTLEMAIERDEKMKQKNN